MKYDFDKVYPRQNTNSAKWDAVEEMFGRRDIISMWVADMDFPTAQPIVEALKERAAHPFYGYTSPGKSLAEAVVERMKRKYNWHIQPEWVMFTAGVIPAISIALKALTIPGDEVILQEPVYYPFFPTVKNSGCQVSTNRLKLSNGRYEMDFDDLKTRFQPKTGMHNSPARVKAILLCNPHNPIGRLWNREELVRLGEIALAHNATVISDEIHCELLYRGCQHTPFATISKEFEQNSITCMAPSKTFNLAGLHASSIIIPNEHLRKRFIEASSGVSGPNLFAYTAMEAAYRYGDEWLEQVLEYLEGNKNFALQYLNEYVPRIKPVEPQGTYLLWLDCRSLGMDDMALRGFMRNRARLGLDDGFLFGSGGSGFQRMNIACPRSVLKEALERLRQAVDSV